MNRVKAEQFKEELINLLYKYNISFAKFMELFSDKDIVRYMAGAEDKKAEFYKYCKKIGFII